MLDEMCAYSSGVTSITVVISGKSRRFVASIERSKLKSVVFLIPRIIATAPHWRAKSPVRQLYDATSIRLSSAYRSLISCTRCSTVSSPRLEILSPTAIITLSKRRNAPSTSDSCPLVNGSNDPGKSAILSIIATKVIINFRSLLNLPTKLREVFNNFLLYNYLID